MENGNSIVVGDIVSGLEPNELVEVRRLAPFGPRTLLEGVTLQTRREIRRPLTDAELHQLTKIRNESHSFDGDPQVFLLGAEAERIRIAHQFDPLFAVNSSVVDILPHQVEAVYRYLLPLPHIRFLLADDTGAGTSGGLERVVFICLPVRPQAVCRRGDTATPLRRNSFFYSARILSHSRRHSSGVRRPFTRASSNSSRRRRWFSDTGR
jgi:hypothetical protein